MAWNIDKSRERIRQHLDGMGDIEIERLVKEADLGTLLSETCCREVYGAHAYVSVSNFDSLASDSTYSEGDYKRLIQGVHIYQREVSRLVEAKDLFDGLRIHFQGPKLHALFYRPIDDAPELAARAFFVQLVMRDVVRNVFNPAFPAYDNFVLSGGADIGTVIGTRNGTRGDRELLFLGSAANRAAKIIRAHGLLRVTKCVYRALPKDLKERCEVVGDDYRILSLEGDELDRLLEDHGFSWDREASKERVEEDKKSFPLKDILYSSATERIKFDDLSISNSKKVQAASVFADVSNFTAFVDAAQDKEAKKAALRVFHTIRKEFARVLRDDYEGVRVQYQGDRIQGLFHLPKDDKATISLEAVSAAAALQSSMEITLKEALPGAEDLHLAVGIDYGLTLASKLGSRGHRDRICLGAGVEDAAEHEENCNGQEVGIGTAVFKALTDDLQGLFSWNEAAACYIAQNLDLAKVERVQRARAMNEAKRAPLFVSTSAAGTTIHPREVPGARPVVPARSWGI
jgi:class 3 adenylate cyclase